MNGRRSGAHPVRERPRAAVASASAARAYAVAVVREEWETPFRRAPEGALVDLRLVVSEMVSNAVRHGGGLTGFEARPEAVGVRVVVRDASDQVPDAVTSPGAFPEGEEHLERAAPGGYGWPLIHRLARDIHVERLPEGGKAVSALIPLTSSRED
ncbi:ATP-binding protein [Streptomyces chilikensis]|uniref:ATP-binding protein n=1 Tax=Streptomyces chilikensis TaxID=1194079 RepID=A0ABV3ETB7_9ACTN